MWLHMLAISRSLRRGARDALRTAAEDGGGAAVVRWAAFSTKKNGPEGVASGPSAAKSGERFSSYFGLGGNPNLLAS
jgi:hypothetical protein